MKRTLLKNQSSRAGLLKVEALLAMLMLVVAMNFAGPMIARINHLWVDTQTHQFAIDELSNQMDVLVQLAPAKVEETLQDLRVSEAFDKAVPGATLTGELSEDQLGQRLTLSLSWIDVADAKPIQLSGWLVSESSKGADREGER